MALLRQSPSQHRQSTKYPEWIQGGFECCSCDASACLSPSLLALAVSTTSLAITAQRAAEWESKAKGGSLLKALSLRFAEKEAPECLQTSFI